MTFAFNHYIVPVLFIYGWYFRLHSLWCRQEMFRARIVEIMPEVIKSMRMVKMYCWESVFIEKVSHTKMDVLECRTSSSQ